MWLTTPNSGGPAVPFPKARRVWCCELPVRGHQQLWRMSRLNWPPAIPHPQKPSHVDPRPFSREASPSTLTPCPSVIAAHAPHSVDGGGAVERAGGGLAVPLGDPREQCRHCRRVMVVVTLVTAMVNVVVKWRRQQKPLGGPLLDWWQQGSGVVQGRAPVSLPLVWRRRQLRRVRHRRASKALESR